MKKYLIGIDIGGTAIKIGKFDLDGMLLEKWDLPTDKSDHGSHILGHIHHSIGEKVASAEIKGIGFGIPGPVSDGVVLRCANLGWSMMRIGDLFQNLLQDNTIDIKVSNDANVAAAGEAFQGIAKGYKNVCLMTIGTGVGGGIIIDGKLVDGINGVAGELGHIPVDSAERFLCGCGKRGCLETVASATGIINLARQYREADPSSVLNQFEPFSAKRVIDLAKIGDPASLKAVNEACEYLAYVLSLVTLVVNPEIFVIGGGVSNAGKFLLDKIEERYYPYVHPFIQKAHFALASLGNDAGMYGAAFLVR